MAAPRGRLYADATSLIGLARIDRLALLSLLASPVLVTAHVWREVAGDPNKPGVPALLTARDQGLLLVVDEGDPTAYPELDAGESTVISAAADARAAVLLDERKARALIAREPSLHDAIPGVSGILGLLLLAKRRGEVTAVRPVVQELLYQHFWIGPRLIEEILRFAGEQSITELPASRPARPKRGPRRQGST